MPRFDLPMYRISLRASGLLTYFLKCPYRPGSRCSTYVHTRVCIPRVYTSHEQRPCAQICAITHVRTKTQKHENEVQGYTKTQRCRGAAPE